MSESKNNSILIPNLGEILALGELAGESEKALTTAEAQSQGYVTVHDMGSYYGKSESRTRKILKDLVNDDKAERVKVTTPGEHPSFWYKAKK